MSIERIWKWWATAGAGLAAILLVNAGALAHCDTMDGPVVTEAVAALENGEVTPVLRWIPAENEAEIRALFDKTRSVRTLGDAAREIADRHFLDTLVRLHRASEGVAFTGLKPAGTPFAPGVAEADAALENGNGEALAKAVAAAIEQKIQGLYETASKAHARKDQSIQAGRDYVAAYVDFVHTVEHLHAVIGSEGHGHAPAPAHPEAHVH